MLPDASAGLEITPVGGAFCIFHPQNGALALLNAAGRAAWANGEASLPEAFKASASQISTSSRSTCAPLPIQPAPEDLWLRSGAARSVRLRGYDGWLAALLGAALAPMAIPPQARADATIDVARRTGAATEVYDLWVGGALRHAGVLRRDIRRRTLTEVALALNGGSQIAAILHACAIGFGSGAILLVGRSGAGKSTLTAALVAAGADYFGDDLIPLSRAGDTIHPFPLGLSVKSGSWEPVGRSFPVLFDQSVHAVRDLRIRYLPVPGPSRRGAVPVTAIVFSSYEPGTEFSQGAVAAEQAFALLVDAGSEILGDPPSARPLAELAERVPAWQISYSLLAPAVAAIREIGGAA